MAKPEVRTDRLNEVFESDPRSDRAIADYFHVSKQSISAWRKGERSPKKSKLEEIAKFYGKDILWFFGFDVQEEEKPVPSKEDEQIRELIDLISGLSDRKKAEAIRYLRYLSESEECE